MDKFPRREVERSFRRFNDIVTDVLSSTSQTWTTNFALLIAHCETDPVMRIVTEPLRQNQDIDAHQWASDAIASIQGVVGSGHYKLPYDEEALTALLYQVLVLVEARKVSLVDFCVSVYGATEFDEMVNMVNRELVLKFTRQVSYRLEKILADIGDERIVPREAMNVFHHYDQSTVIHGNVQGSNIATSGGAIAESSASFQSAAELGGAFRELLALAREIEAGQREEVERCIEVLIAAAATGQGDVGEVKSATATIIAASPKLHRRLRDIAGRIGTSLVASSIFQVIKTAVGIP